MVSNQSKSKYYLCITPFFPSPDNCRGAYVFDQVKAIERNSNYKVIVFVPCSLFKQKEAYIIDGVKVHYIRSWFMPSNFFNGFGDFINRHNILKALDKIGVSLDDIAVVHSHTAAFAPYLSGLKQANKDIKTVIQYHDLDPYQTRMGRFATWKPNLIYRVKKFVNQFENIDLHLCISNRTKYNLIQFPKPHPKETYEPYLEVLSKLSTFHTPQNINTYVLYNGVNTSVFKPRAKEKSNGIFKIGCIANFQELKDHITLIKAIEILVKEKCIKNINVSFIGSGETKDSCIEYIDNHGLQQYFIFEREMKHEQLPDYYNSLDLFVLPSCFEGFGCVYTEAAACGVPFMGCLYQGYSEYIYDEDRDKWLIEPHDFRQLANIILRQIESPSPQALKFEYDINILISQYLQFIASDNDY